MHKVMQLMSTTLMLGLFTWSAASCEPLAKGRTGGGIDYIRQTPALHAQARRGNAKAEAKLGFMYENGLGVPQAYDAAADLYIRGAQHGDPTAQYLLGLAYDKGHGVEQDAILAHMWLNLAAAHVTGYNRERYLTLRDAVASKMTRAQIATAQRLALEWVPKPGW
jgi:TPR repeat protein